jgi:TetR/AcrR family transcriptional regulator
MVKPSSLTRRRTTPARRPPTPPARDRDTEQRILDAAHVVFVRRGSAGARMQEIAEEAGVNKALLHYYFRNKARLGEAIFRRVAAALFGRLGAILGGPATLDEKVRQVVALYLDQLSATPYAPGYVINEINQHPERAKQLLEAIGHLRTQAIGEHFIATLDRQLKDAARAGRIRPISIDQFLANLASLCVFPFVARPMLCAVLQLDDRGFERFVRERKATLPDFILNALRP